MSSSDADDLNAEFVANQWLRDEIIQICTLVGSVAERTEFVLYAFRESGMDVALARAEWELGEL